MPITASLSGLPQIHRILMAFQSLSTGSSQQHSHCPHFLQQLNRNDLRTIWFADRSGGVVVQAAGVAGSEPRDTASLYYHYPSLPAQAATFTHLD